jgi:3-oxoacyl-[acyl-carrier-protein] synthase-1
MKRVMVTGLGILSSIGNHIDDVLAALINSYSGLEFMSELQDLGLKCRVYGPVKGWNSGKLGKRATQTMSTVAQYATVAALDALQDAGLEPKRLQNERTGIVVGTAFGGVSEVFPIEELVLRRKSPSRAGMTGVVKIMNSTASGNLAAYLGVKGHTLSLSSSFASGTDNIGLAYELVKYGVEDVCICGAAEEDCWKQLGVYFDNWGGMPKTWNDRPTQACRPYDREREGFVMSAGAGILVLEAMEHAERRGARIYAEVIGYGSANDGVDMFRPSGMGLKQAIQQALAAASKKGVKTIDYINGHGTGTPLGDRIEVEAIKRVFKSSAPPLSSTKGLAGHGMGATGAQEAVYVLLMLRNNFLAPTANLQNIAQECSGVPHIQSIVEKELRTAMSINVGLGGAASCIIFKKI